ncbi:MAG: esterase [Symbiobacteriaceae bacterium]|nr:esterase [Symbiobacteriaceae bacterium]
MKRFMTLLLLFVLLLTWIPRSVHAAVNVGRTPVIFVPGIAGTELYNDNELVWLNTWRLVGSQIPILNLFQMSWLLPLRLAADGTAPYYSSSRIRTGDIMRRSLTNIYGELLAALKQDGYVEGQDLYLFPYDWRMDLTLTADRLGAEVDRVLARTRTDKVVLLSHSMGGLIARDYVVRGGAAKVEATISMATPWLGAPMAYRALAYGWDMGLKLPGTKWSALAPRDVKLLAQNYPSVYALAPSRQYFDLYPGGYLTRGGRALGYAGSVSKGLAPHNSALAGRGASYYDRLLDGSSHGVRQFVIAGRGRQTLVGITERRDWLGATHKTERMADGDEVVPALSADLGYGQDPARAERYLGDLEAVAYANEPHIFFTGAPAVQTTVRQWLRGLND